MSAEPMRLQGFASAPPLCPPRGVSLCEACRHYFCSFILLSYIIMLTSNNYYQIKITVNAILDENKRIYFIEKH